MRKNTTRRNTVALAAGLALLTVLAGLGPAHAIGDVEDRGPKMVGGGWIGIGNPNDKVHVQVHLPCPGAEVGFNPQPDPPGRDRASLTVHQGASRFTLTAVEAASCSNNLHEGSGTGTCDGEGGFVIDWRLTDGALGGPDTRPDMASLEISGTHVRCSRTVADALSAGNFKMVAPPEPD